MTTNDAEWLKKKEEEYRTNAAKLPPGPWTDEPNRVEFEHKGVPCLMVRQPGGWHWCGYAAVPPGHPWHGKGYDGVEVDIHGGLTFADACGGLVCHVPKPGEPDNVWWFGFDCAHFDDLRPMDRVLLGDRFSFPGDPDTYRDAHYVRAQCKRLAEQILAAREVAP